MSNCPNKKEFILTAFEDQNGSLGWGIGELAETFAELDACIDGALLAHDLLEHNHASTLTGVTNELEAIGAAEYVRQGLELQHDIVNMSRSIIYDPIDTIKNIDGGYFDVFTKIAASEIPQEMDLAELSSEERKNISNYLRFAPSHMNNGYEWASAYYQEFNANGMFKEIERKFQECEYEGQQAKIYLDFENNTVIFDEYYGDEYYDEDYSEDE
jgi:hypothetical protein